MRKLLSLLVCLSLLMCLVPSVQATQTNNKINDITAEAKRVYRYSLSTAGQESFQGFCGLMVGHQLYHMGINSSLEVYDGNKQYDVYSQKEQTSGGYYPTAYPADTYSLADALNAITRHGTRDAYNILVGFEKTTTEAGAFYGHACVINAIIDGTVYLVESFYTSMAGPEGNVIACSIEELDAYFSSWMTLEGVIHFGNGTFTDTCQSFETDIFVRMRFASILRSQPCLIDDNGCEKLRDLQPGEMLHVQGVFQNDLGEVYYQVFENGQEGFVMANAAMLLQVNKENITFTEGSIPVIIPQGRALTLSGQVTAKRGNLEGVTARLTDEKGNVLCQNQLEDCGIQADLSQLSLDVASLEKGCYQLCVYATPQYVTCQGPELEVFTEEILLYQNTLQIGKPSNLLTRNAFSAPIPEPLDGFVWQEGKWFVYQDGAPANGWFTYLGVKYYAHEDGKLATGWENIDGESRYFTPNGCLFTGQLTQADGSRYLMAEGIVQEVDTTRVKAD